MCQASQNLNFQLNSTFYQIKSSIHLAFKSPEILLPLKVNHTYCAQFGQEPTAEEVKEERDLLNSIAWPGPLVKGLPVELSSDPAKSYFVIQGPPVQHIGDQLVVNVHMHNFLDQPKKHGGDFLIARLHSPELGAGVAGKVHDHQNGNYTVLFPLLWAGVVHVQITMVHPSEAVVVFKRLQEEQPDRVFFKSMFRSGHISEATVCNLCLPLNEKPLCNYTDPKTKEPWYCYKPQNLSCDTRITHSKGGYTRNITQFDEQFFQRVKIKVSIPASVLGKVTVLPAEKVVTPSTFLAVSLITSAVVAQSSSTSSPPPSPCLTSSRNLTRQSFSLRFHHLILLSVFTLLLFFFTSKTILQTTIRCCLATLSPANTLQSPISFRLHLLHRT
ncbi:NXPE family member 3 precursor [Silurus asotus]|uniref:NXPE family member 3 n=1 Tax=Silurus asotus TaxID=30991 RepID=A0AAD4ZZC4_SILAS|nr:NXPE family member 3 precursor [Silurus asotus]